MPDCYASKEDDISRLLTYIEQIKKKDMRKSERGSKRVHFDKGGPSSTKTLEPRRKRKRETLILLMTSVVEYI